MKRNELIILTPIFLFALSGCASAPRYPSDKAWNKTPILMIGDDNLLVQGNFKNSVEKWLLAATQVKERMTKKEVKQLGFSTDIKDYPCDTVGFSEASDIALGRNNNAPLEIKKRYSGIRCRALDDRKRTDRSFPPTFINTQNTYINKIDANITFIFLDDDLEAVDFNKQLVKLSNRNYAFLKILSDFAGINKINLDPKKLVPGIP